MLKYLDDAIGFLKKNQTIESAFDSAFAYGQNLRGNLMSGGQALLDSGSFRAAGRMLMPHAIKGAVRGAGYGFAYGAGMDAYNSLTNGGYVDPRSMLSAGIRMGVRGAGIGAVTNTVFQIGAGKLNVSAPAIASATNPKAMTAGAVGMSQAAPARTMFRGNSVMSMAPVQTPPVPTARAFTPASISSIGGRPVSYGYGSAGGFNFNLGPMGARLPATRMGGSTRRMSSGRSWNIGASPTF